MRPPRIVIASLSAIAVIGLFFSITSTLGGAATPGAFFLTLPLSAAACLRVIRFSRTALFLCALGAMVPLMIGIVITWPDALAGAPYMIGVVALFAGLAGMLSETARAWYASRSAHKLLGL